MSDLVIIGDEAWTSEEWELQKVALEKRREVTRRWRAANPDRVREIRRRSARKRRAEKKAEALRAGEAVRITGSLHDLRCTGPTKDTGCVCRKTLIIERMERAA